MNGIIRRHWTTGSTSGLLSILARLMRYSHALDDARHLESLVRVKLAVANKINVRVSMIELSLKPIFAFGQDIPLLRTKGSL